MWCNTWLMIRSTKNPPSQSSACGVIIITVGKKSRLIVVYVAPLKIQNVLSPTHLLPAHHTTTSSLPVKRRKKRPLKRHMHTVKHTDTQTHTNSVPCSISICAFTAVERERERETKKKREREREREGERET